MITVWSNRECGSGNENLKRVHYLKGHRSTVVSLTPFIMNKEHFLLSAGKDRQLRIWKNVKDCEYEQCACMMKAHSRIIWCSSIIVDGLQDCTLFATGSRDMTVKIWKFDLEHTITVGQKEMINGRW